MQKNLLQRKSKRKTKDPSLVKERKMAEGTDPTTVLALILALGGVDPVPGLTPPVEDRAPEGDSPLVEEALPDVDPPARDTDIDVLPYGGGALVLLHLLAVVHLVPDHLERQ